MADTRQLDGHVDLFCEAWGIHWNTVANRLQLKSNSSETLRQRVMNFLGEARTFFRHNASPLEFRQNDEGYGGKWQEDKRDHAGLHRIHRDQARR